MENSETEMDKDINPLKKNHNSLMSKASLSLSSFFRRAIR